MKKREYVIPVLIITAVYLALSFFEYSRNRDKLIEKEKGYVRVTKNMLESSYLRWVDEASSVAEYLVIENKIENLKYDTDNYKHLSSILKASMRNKKHYVSTQIIDYNGTELLKISRVGTEIVETKNQKIKNYKNEHIFKETMELDEGKIYISKIQYSKDDSGSSELFVDLSIPIMNSIHKREGIIVFKFLLTDTIDKIRNFDVVLKGSIIIADKYGEIINDSHWDFPKEGENLIRRMGVSESGEIVQNGIYYFFSSIEPFQKNSNIVYEYNELKIIGKMDSRDFFSIVLIILSILYFVIILIAIKILNGIQNERIKKEKYFEELTDIKIKFDIIMTSVKEGIIIMDTDAKILFTSNTALKIMGLLEEELDGKNMKNIIKPEVYSLNLETAVRELSEETKDELRSKISEVKMKKNNGEVVDIEFVINLYEAKNDKKIVMVLRDITEKKKILDQIKLLSNAVERTADMLFITDVEGRFTYVNPAFEKITGFSKDEALGKNVSIIKSGLNTNEYYEQLWSEILQGNVFHAQVANHKKDGDLFYYDQTVTPVRNEDGEIEYFISSGKDITEKKRTEEFLIENERKFRAIFDSVFQLVIIVGEDGTILEINQTAQEYLGAKNDEITKLKIWDAPWLGNSDYAPKRLKESFEKVLKGEFIRYEEYFINRHSLITVFDFSMKPYYNSSGKLTMIISEARDITDLQRARDILERDKATLERLIAERTKELLKVNENLLTEIKIRRQTESALENAKIAAESANIAKSIFLANMSHEIRTPLNAILGFSQLLVQDEKLDWTYKERINIINNSGQHLLSLINDILELSKIEAGRVILNLGDFNFFRMIKDVENIFLIKVKEKGIYLNVELSERLPEILFGDEKKIKQIFINIIGNAIKFTDIGGITVNIDSEPIHDGIKISVKIIDTGIGIHNDDLEKIFGHFEQAEKRPNDRGGSGLGLSISKQFVKLMGGDISVDSVVGVGSTFRFSILLKDSKNKILNVPKEKKIKGIKENYLPLKILLADDNEYNRLLLKESFQNIGFTIKEAGNGREAVEITRIWEPDIILMDVKMPVMDGLESFKEIRALKLNKQVKVIFMTASAIKSEKIEELFDKSDGFVTKPVIIEDILEKIRVLKNIEYNYFETEEKKKEVEKKEFDFTKRVVIHAKELLGELNKATIEGDVEKMIKIAKHIKEHDKEFGDELLELIKNYNFEKIFKMCEMDAIE